MEVQRETKVARVSSSATRRRRLRIARSRERRGGRKQKKSERSFHRSTSDAAADSLRKSKRIKSK